MQPVESMPGICQYSLDRMSEELDRVVEAGIPAILLFGIRIGADNSYLKTLIIKIQQSLSPEFDTFLKQHGIFCFFT